MRTSTGPREVREGPKLRHPLGPSTSQVGLDHGGMLGDLTRQSQRDRASLIENLDAIAELHDQPQVVIDDHDRAIEVRSQVRFPGALFYMGLPARFGHGAVAEAIQEANLPGSTCAGGTMRLFGSRLMGNTAI